MNATGHIIILSYLVLCLQMYVVLVFLKLCVRFKIVWYSAIIMLSSHSFLELWCET